MTDSRCLFFPVEFTIVGFGFRVKFSTIGFYICHKRQTPNRVIQTCRAQGRSVIEFFKQVLMAQGSAEVSKPFLIPQT